VLVSFFYVEDNVPLNRLCKSFNEIKLHGCERYRSVDTSFEGGVDHLNTVSCEKLTADK